MKNYFSFIFLLLFSFIYGQNTDIDYISFEYSKSYVIGADVDIEIFQSTNKKIGDSVIVRITKHSFKEKKDISTDFIVEKKKFLNLCSKINKIKPNQILKKENYIIFDPDTFKLSFGNRENKISYSTDNLSHHKKLKNIIKEILEIAQVKIRGINK